MNKRIDFHSRFTAQKASLLMAVFSISFSQPVFAQSFEDRILSAKDFNTARALIDQYINQVASQVTATGTYPAPNPPVGLAWVRSLPLGDGTQMHFVDELTSDPNYGFRSSTRMLSESDETDFSSDVVSYARDPYRLMAGMAERSTTESGLSKSDTTIHYSSVSGNPRRFPIVLGRPEVSAYSSEHKMRMEMGFDDSIHESSSRQDNYAHCVAIGERTIQIDGYEMRVIEDVCGTVLTFFPEGTDPYHLTSVGRIFRSVELGFNLETDFVGVSSYDGSRNALRMQVTSLDRSKVAAVARQMDVVAAAQTEEEERIRADAQQMLAEAQKMREQAAEKNSGWGWKDWLGLTSDVMSAGSMISSVDSPSSQQLGLLTDLVAQNAQEGSFLSEVANFANLAQDSMGMISSIDSMSTSQQARLLTSMIAQDGEGTVLGEITSFMGTAQNGMDAISMIDSMSTAQQARLLTDLLAQDADGAVVGKVAQFASQAQSAMDIVRGVDSMSAGEQAEFLAQLLAQDKTMRQSVTQGIAKARQSMNSGKQDWELNLAVGDLLDLIGSNDSSLNSYEKAMLWLNLGHLYYELDNKPESVSSFEKAVAENSLEDDRQISTIKNIGGLKFILEDYAGAVEYLMQYLRLNPNAEAVDHFNVGAAYSRLNEFSRSIDYLNRSLSLARSSGIKPKETWLALLGLSHRKLGQLDQYVGTMQDLYNLYPTEENRSSLDNAVWFRGSNQPEVAAQPLQASTHSGSTVPPVNSDGYTTFAESEYLRSSDSGCLVWNTTRAYYQKGDDSDSGAIVQAQEANWSGQCLGDKGHGPGSLTYWFEVEGFPMSMTFNGELYEGRMSGEGVMIWPSGTRYEGNFENHRVSGKGILTQSNGNIWEGKFAGTELFNGVITYMSGNKFIGTLDNGFFSRGKIYYSNGAVYSGNFKDGKFHGFGLYIWEDGDFYVGSFYENKRSGYGLHTHGGNYYFGEQKGGYRNGVGTYVWSDGSLFIGNWLDGVRSGAGNLLDADGDLYIGNFENSQQHGEGTVYLDDGSAFDTTYFESKLLTKSRVSDERARKEGSYWALNLQATARLARTYRDNAFMIAKLGAYPDWSEVKVGDKAQIGLFRDGQIDFGQEKRADGSFWEGSFKNGIPHGEGRFVFSNGQFYVGQVKNGILDGVGIQVWPTGNQIFSGQWVNGQPVKGMLYYPSGDLYDGDVKSTSLIKHGQGTYRYLDGARYEGTWQDGKRTGQGIYHYGDGSIWNGTWRDDKEWDGVYIKYDGSTTQTVNGKGQRAYSDVARNTNSYTPPGTGTQPKESKFGWRDVLKIGSDVMNATSMIQSVDSMSTSEMSRWVIDHVASEKAGTAAGDVAEFLSTTLNTMDSLKALTEKDKGDPRHGLAGDIDSIVNQTETATKLANQAEAQARAGQSATSGVPTSAGASSGPLKPNALGAYSACKTHSNFQIASLFLVADKHYDVYRNTHNQMGAAAAIQAYNAHKVAANHAISVARDYGVSSGGC